MRKQDDMERMIHEAYSARQHEEHQSSPVNSKRLSQKSQTAGSRRQSQVSGTAQHTTNYTFDIPNPPPPPPLMSNPKRHSAVSTTTTLASRQSFEQQQQQPDNQKIIIDNNSDRPTSPTKERLTQQDRLRSVLLESNLRVKDMINKRSSRVLEAAGRKKLGSEYDAIEAVPTGVLPTSRTDSVGHVIHIQPASQSLGSVVTREQEELDALEQTFEELEKELLMQYTS